MPSIFKENDVGLTTTFAQVSAATLAGLGAGDYYTLAVTPGRMTSVNFKSTLDVEVSISLQKTVTNSNTIKTMSVFEWIVLDNGDTFSMQSSFSPQLWIDGRVLILVQATGAAPSTGSLYLYMSGDDM